VIGSVRDSSHSLKKRGGVLPNISVSPGSLRLTIKGATVKAETMEEITTKHNTTVKNFLNIPYPSLNIGFLNNYT